MSFVSKTYNNIADAKLVDKDFMEGKYVLLTGVADPKGLGAQLLNFFCEMRIAGAILIDIDERVANGELVAKCVGMGVKDVFTAQADVTDDASMADLAPAIAGFLAGNKLSYVMAGAGYFAPSTAMYLDMEAFARAMDVTVKGTSYTFQLAESFAADQCIFIGAGSAASDACFVDMTIYNVAKAALEAYINSLKGEYAGTGWEFHCMKFAQVEGTQLSQWFSKLEFARTLLARNKRAARVLNRHASARPAIRSLVQMGRGGMYAELYRQYPKSRVVPLATLPTVARPVIRKLIGSISEDDRVMMRLDAERETGRVSGLLQ
ncbi:SDR family oxidoreductase [Candidatus Mycosynbacter amalyticus]|uniref:SDR family oxidoreductase n=1 Tax=Candidatus Mycosynbacter amalyticus TaxID=2665156 RepID=A0A857MLB2_9BACT|nr:SDR family oxidoreductase [Candidatus Mycosynbacter amalyticus]QHN42402.1 SDR family oxidoreductase [Candidatus Mycosynbacter amalyticus]